MLNWSRNLILQSCNIVPSVELFQRRNTLTFTFADLTVGGRTSCVVPSVQKKTGAVAGDMKKEELNEAEDADSKKESKPKANASKKRKTVVDKEEDVKPEEEEQEPKTKAKKTKATPKAKPSKVKTEDAPSEGRRRSGRAAKAK